MIKYITVVAMLGMGHLIAAQSEVDTQRYASDAKKPVPQAQRESIAFLPSDVGFKVYGEFLYWKSSTDPLPYATSYFNQPLPAAIGGGTIPNNVEFQSVKFKYGPGFRVGALYAFAFDLWDVAFTWTQFDQKAKSHVVVDELGFTLNTLWALTLNYPTSAFATQKERFINLDFEIGRTWHVTQHFFLRGAISPELAWITEQLHIAYMATPNRNSFRSNSDVTIKNQVGAVGAGVSVRPSYYMGYGFSVYGLGKVAVYVASLTLSTNELLEIIEQPSGTTVDIPLTRKNTLYNEKANFVVNLGLEWGKDLYAKALGISASLGYEFNYWPNLMELLQLANETTTQPLILNQFSDLSFQGITARLSLYF